MDAAARAADSAMPGRAALRLLPPARQGGGQAPQSVEPAQPEPVCRYIPNDIASWGWRLRTEKVREWPSGEEQAMVF